MKKIVVALFTLVLILVGSFNSKFFAQIDGVVAPPPLISQEYLDFRERLYYGGDNGGVLAAPEKLLDLKAEIEEALENADPETTKLLNQLLDKIYVQLDP